MKALILNSGIGKRMETLTINKPKCMIKISTNETIISRQLRQINEAGLKEVIITTGPFHNILVNYCDTLNLPLKITYVNNPLNAETN